MERATATSPRSLLATAGRRRRRCEEQRHGLTNQFDRDRLLGWRGALRKELAACNAARQGGEGEIERGTDASINRSLLSQPQLGGVVAAYESSAVSIIGSTVTDCSAGVRRVELAADPATPLSSGARDREPRLTSSRSPRNRRRLASPKLGCAVELATRLAATPRQWERDREGRGCLTPLSRNRSSAASPLRGTAVRSRFPARP